MFIKHYEFTELSLYFLNDLIHTFMVETVRTLFRCFTHERRWYFINGFVIIISLMIHCHSVFLKPSTLSDQTSSLEKTNTMNPQKRLFNLCVNLNQVWHKDCHMLHTPNTHSRAHMSTVPSEEIKKARTHTRTHAKKIKIN